MEPKNLFEAQENMGNLDKLTAQIWILVYLFAAFRLYRAQKSRTFIIPGYTEGLRETVTQCDSRGYI